MFVLAFESLNIIIPPWDENIRNTRYIKVESCGGVIVLLSLLVNIYLPEYTVDLFVKLIQFIVLIKVHVPLF